jgi:hypothetical protein
MKYKNSRTYDAQGPLSATELHQDAGQRQHWGVLAVLKDFINNHNKQITVQWLFRLHHAQAAAASAIAQMARSQCWLVNRTLAPQIHTISMKRM